MSKELEQKAREIADRRIPPDKIIDGDRVWGGRNGQAEKWLHAKEAALEALQLKQNIIDRLENQRKFDNDMIADKDKTIASLHKEVEDWESALLAKNEEYKALQERCERLEKQSAVALFKAIEAIYFDDSSDYSSYLWGVVHTLGGDDAVNLLENEDSEAYQKYKDEAESLLLKQALTETKGGEV